jgi:hypothetical protein
MPSPSIEDFLDRYPEFAPFDERQIILVLAEVVQEVGESWITYDRTAATLALTAHRLYSEQSTIASLGGTSAVSGGATSGPITRETVGPLSVQYNKGNTSSSGGTVGMSSAGIDLESSPYGVRFLELVRRSFPAVAVV